MTWGCVFDLTVNEVSDMRIFGHIDPFGVAWRRS